MIVLTVLSYNGAPASGPSASFDEMGGSIGRADNNQLVLPDPERTISRVHARVLYRGGGYAIVDNGSNPIHVNGRALGAGREHALQMGDEIEIGGYRLRVAPAAAAAPGSDDPFADLFGPAAAGLAAPAAPAAPKPSAMHSWPAAVPAAPAFAAPTAPTAPGQIPDDWDPFAPEPQASRSPASRAPLPTAADPFGFAAPQPAGAGGAFNLGGSESLDALFGLDGVVSSDPLGSAPAVAPPVSTLELGSELNTPMPLAPPARLRPSPAAAPPTAAPAPQGAVFSWDAAGADSTPVTMIVPRARAGASGGSGAALPPASNPLLNAPQSAPPARAAAPAPANPPRPVAGATAAGTDALLDALLQGLATPSLRIDALTPELMQLVGTLLRESTRGAVQLLVARAALKREMRAQMTMIVARENNPLKFSPSAEVALQHLLGAPAPGFMAPADAVRDAFDDLRAHQMAVMAGMRAALDGVLQRFDPEQLQGKLAPPSAIASLVPAMRKARLWELFNELFGQLQREAQDDFDELFGKAFLQAYEAQLDRLAEER